MNIRSPSVTGGSGVASTLSLRSTTGVGAAGADIVFQVGNNGATEAMRILNNGNVGIGRSPLTDVDIMRAGGPVLRLTRDDANDYRFDWDVDGTNTTIGARDSGGVILTYGARLTGATLTGGGTWDVAVNNRSPLYSTTTNCADSAGDAACAAAPAGSVVIDAADTNTVVSTTAVTPDSQVVIQEDSSLGTRLSVTCNTTIARTYVVTARTAGVSFTVTASAAPVANPACLSYFLVN